MAPRRKKVTNIQRDEPNKVDAGDTSANKTIEAGATVEIQQIDIQPSTGIPRRKRPLMKIFPVKLQPATTTGPSGTSLLPGHTILGPSQTAAKTVCLLTDEPKQLHRGKAKQARVDMWLSHVNRQFKADLLSHKAWLVKNGDTIHHELQDTDDVVGKDLPDFEDCRVWLQYHVLLFGWSNLNLFCVHSGKIIPILAESDMVVYDSLIQRDSRPKYRHTTLYPTGKWTNLPTKREIMKRFRRLAGELLNQQTRPPAQEPETTTATCSKKKKPKNPAVPLDLKEKLQKASSVRKPILYGDEEVSHTFSQAYKCLEASTIHKLRQMNSWYTRVRQEDLDRTKEFLEDVLE